MRLMYLISEPQGTKMKSYIEWENHILRYALKSEFFRLRNPKSITRPYRKAQSQKNI